LTTVIYDTFFAVLAVWPVAKLVFPYSIFIINSAGEYKRLKVSYEIVN